MILVEFVTNTGKTVAFAHTGVLSIKNGIGEVNFSKINKEQAFDLACILMDWSNEQPDSNQTTSSQEKITNGRSTIEPR